MFIEISHRLEFMALSVCKSQFVTLVQNVLALAINEQEYSTSFYISKNNLCYSYSSYLFFHGILTEQVWLVQLIRSLTSSHKVPGSILSFAEIRIFVRLSFLPKLTQLSILPG